MCEIIAWPNHLCGSVHVTDAVDSQTARRARCAVCGSEVTDTTQARAVEDMDTDTRRHGQPCSCVIVTCARCAAEYVTRAAQPGSDRTRTT
jgi:ribosomal protein L34E